jgi:hypothetical protein
MTPFFVFRAPNKKTQFYIPRGPKKFRIVAWIKLPYTSRDSDEILVNEPVYLQDLFPVLEQTANELMDKAMNELFEHWAKFLLSVDDKTTDDEIDIFHDNFPKLDYGFECYIRR